MITSISPLWTPDGRHIVFRSDRNDGTSNLYWMRADGGGEAQRIAEHKIGSGALPGSFSPNGTLAYMLWDNTTRQDIWILPLDLTDPDHPKPGKAKPLLHNPYNEYDPAFSPDGRWLAYFSNESGSAQVYVSPFPGPGGKYQVSPGGGDCPLWSRTARELFYRNNANQIMVAGYAVQGETFLPEKPRLWSEKRVSGPYTFDLAPDGRRFAVITPVKEAEGTQNTHLVIVQNFFDELRRRVPAGAR